MGEKRNLQLRSRLELVSGLWGLKDGRLCQSLEGLRLGESGGWCDEEYRDWRQQWSRTPHLRLDQCPRKPGYW